MKYLFLLLILLACKKPEPNTPMETPAPPAGNWGWVPTWRTDTMVNGYRLGSDTFFSWKSNDTTGVIYGGDTLYIFGTFDTTKVSSLTAWIGPDALDTSTAYSKCFVGFYRWFSVNDNKARFQAQLLNIINRYPNFNTTGDAYYLGRP